MTPKPATHDFTGRYSPRLAREALSQPRNPLERCLGQGPFAHSFERLLELLQRRHADQDGAHRRVRDGEARRCLGEAPGISLLQQRQEAARATSAS